MSFRRFSTLAATAAAASFLLLSKGSFGQSPAATPSATDRQAARDLYLDGAKLQDQGKYDQALDRFRRAEAVFPAVTTQLHIAECQASLGQLIESAETYRQVIQTQLPPDASAAFKAAQQQASAELPQVDSRIAQLEIDVTPNGIAGLEVKLDGKAVNPALLGVRQPINPGPHRVVARAPKYATLTADLPIAAGQKDAVLPMQMRPDPGAPAGADVPPLPTPAPYSANDNAPVTNATNAGAPVPAPYQSSAPARSESSSSFILGGRLGVNGIGGNLANGVKASDYVGGGGSIAGEIGLRFAQYLYIGVTGEYAAYGAGDTLANVDSTSIHSEMVGGVLGVMSNPHGLAGFYGEVGGAYRWLHLEETQKFAAGSYDDPIALSGAELLVGVGVTIHPNRSVLILPKIDLGFGSFSSHDESGCSGSLVGHPCPSIANFESAAHVSAVLAVGLYFDKGL